MLQKTLGLSWGSAKYFVLTRPAKDIAKSPTSLGRVGRDSHELSVARKRHPQKLDLPSPPELRQTDFV